MARYKLYIVLYCIVCLLLIIIIIAPPFGANDGSHAQCYKSVACDGRAWLVCWLIIQIQQQERTARRWRNKDASHQFVMVAVNAVVFSSSLHAIFCYIVLAFTPLSS